MKINTTIPSSTHNATKDLKRAKKRGGSSDSGYFAEPARGQENNLRSPDKQKIEVSNSLISDTIHDKKEEIEIINKKIPSLLSLFRKKSISSMANFYPKLFWHTRRFTFVYIFLNELRKSGIIYSIKLAVSAIKWKLSLSMMALEKSNDDEALSLRKTLRKGNLPRIDTDNPAMEKLRLGR